MDESPDSGGLRLAPIAYHSIFTRGGDRYFTCDPNLDPGGDRDAHAYSNSRVPITVWENCLHLPAIARFRA